MLFIPVLFAAACLTNGLENACIGDECATKDDAVLVQKTRVPRKVEKDDQKGLALEGGGFLSHAAHTGVLTALLNRVISPPTPPSPPPTPPSPPPTPYYRGYMHEGLAEKFRSLRRHWWSRHRHHVRYRLEEAGYGTGGFEPGTGLTELMKNMKVISSASGGSWWMAQLAYSKVFADLVDAMATVPHQAGVLYREHWIDPFINALMKSSSIPDSVLEDLKNLDSFKDLVKLGADLGPLLKEMLGSMMRDATPGENETLSANASDEPVNSSDEIVGDSFGENALEVILEVAIVFLAAGGVDWQKLNELLLTSTTPDLDKSLTLGSPEVNQWAKDKWWLIGAAISSPGGFGPGTCQQKEGQVWCLDSQMQKLNLSAGFDKTFVYQNSTGGDAWEYSAPPSNNIGYNTSSWTPARFSAVLGAGAKEAAPLPFCETGCENLQLQYDAMGQTHVSNKAGKYRFFGFGDTSLFGAVSTSTAFMGWITDIDSRVARPIATMLTKQLRRMAWEKITGLPEKWFDIVKCLAGHEVDLEQALSQVWSIIDASVAKLLTAKMAVWVQSAQDGKEAFSEASHTLEYITEKNGATPDSTLKYIADKKLMALVDGGLTDNSGIGHALRAGSREIICFEPLMDHVWRLMGGKDYKELLLPSDAALLSDLLPTEWKAIADAMAGEVNTCPLCYANFQLFEETVETAQEDWKVYAKHFQVPKDVHSVKAINYATLELTTKKNDYFGIHAGERVFVRILNVESSSKSIGGLNYYDFATLVQDIVKVMLDPSNEEATGTVLKWFEN